jgi:hypothetical protein
MKISLGINFKRYQTAPALSVASPTEATDRYMSQPNLFVNPISDDPNERRDRNPSDDESDRSHAANTGRAHCSTDRSMLAHTRLVQPLQRPASQFRR